MKFLHGDVYRAYTAVGDIAGVLYLVGVVWALLRRYGPRRFRPYRIRIKSKPEHAAVLLIFLAIGVTGFGAEAFRIALQDTASGGYGADAETWSVVGYPLAMAIVEVDWLVDDLAGWHQGWWIAHVGAFLAFLALLPITMKRLGIDPALAGSVVLTTITDIVGFFAFLGLATVLYAHLLT